MRPVLSTLENVTVFERLMNDMTQVIDITSICVPETQEEFNLLYFREVYRENRYVNVQREFKYDSGGTANWLGWIARMPEVGTKKHIPLIDQWARVS